MYNKWIAASDQLTKTITDEYLIQTFLFQKKYQCHTYQIQNTATKEETNNKKREQYTLHITNKCVAKRVKYMDKAISQESNYIITACFDLQKILTTPPSELLFYYKRKF